jgi:molybdopterin synthase catalytic subunit
MSASPILLAEVTETPIDPAALLALVDRPSVGAIALFVGRVRDRDPGAAGAVVALDYTCHPSAPARLGEIVAAELARLDPGGECQIATAHRIGHLTVGETAFVVAVSAVHRALAFEVCQGLVDAVKRDLPIWKQQFEADGHHTWSGL